MVEDDLEQRLRRACDPYQPIFRHERDDLGRQAVDRLKRYREALEIARPWLESTALACSYHECTEEDCASVRARNDLAKFDELIALQNEVKDAPR